MLLELMEMLFPLISYIIVLQKRFTEILKSRLLHSYGTGADSADHGRSGVNGMSVLTFPGTGADSADHGRSSSSYYYTDGN